jgi:hypothetical protein
MASKAHMNVTTTLLEAWSNLSPKIIASCQRKGAGRSAYVIFGPVSLPLFTTRSPRTINCHPPEGSTHNNSHRSREARELKGHHPESRGSCKHLEDGLGYSLADVVTLRGRTMSEFWS